MRDLPVCGRDIAAPDREDRTLRDRSFDRALELEEVVVTPDRLDPDERGGVLEPRPRLTVPREAIEQPTMHDVHAIDEPALRVEIGTHSQQGRVIAVRIAGPVIQRDVPQLAGADPGPPGGVFGPRAGELRG